MNSQPTPVSLETEWKRQVNLQSIICDYFRHPHQIPIDLATWKRVATPLEDDEDWSEWKGSFQHPSVRFVVNDGDTDQYPPDITTVVSHWVPVDS